MAARWTWEEVASGAADDQIAEVVRSLGEVGGVWPLGIDLAGRVDPHPLLGESNEPNGAHPVGGAARNGGREMSTQPTAENDAAMTRCTCGAQAIRPYPNDTGYHSTTECINEESGRVIPPGSGDTTEPS